MNPAFFSSPTGKVVLIALALVAGGVALFWQRQRGQLLRLPVTKAATVVAMPKTFTREGARFTPKPAVAVTAEPTVPPAPEKPRAAIAPKTEPAAPVLPISIYTAASERGAPRLFAPYGRLIPCETVVTLESNHLETPVIGLVTEDLWHDGRLVVPKGAEVHGRAALDRNRERLAAAGAWTIVWRTTDRDNGTELAVQGLALDREIDPKTDRWGEHDGSAGLRGTVIRTDDDRELKLFAATFLSTATLALQTTQASVGLLGETAMPVATARNASLAGTSAVLREYAQQIKDSIARDGLYLRVPAGTRFYLYVTQTLDRSEAKRGTAATAAPTHP